MVTLYKPNLSALQQEAAQAREAEKRRSELKGDIVWANITEEGPNIFRVLPSTNSRGTVGKRIYNHDYKWAGKEIAKLMEDFKKNRCVELTHPEANMSCPICAVGSKLVAQFPHLKINQWHSPKENPFTQVHDRGDKQYVGAKMLRLTSKVYNWVIVTMEEALQDSIQPVDITDLQAGIDIKITKEVTVTQKNGRTFKNTKYTPSLWNLHGPSPLHPDQAVVERIISTMKDLDDIWKVPDDEQMAKIHKAAAMLEHHYMSMAAKEAAQISVPGNVGGQLAAVSQPAAQPAAQSTVVQESQPATQPTPPPAETVPASPPDPQPAAVATVSDAHPAVQAAAAQNTTETTAQSVAAPPAAAPAEQPPAPAEPPSATTAAAPSTPPPVSQGGEPAPTDRPACFAGEANRGDAAEVGDDGIGYNSDSEQCLMCKYELQCMQKCEEKGLSQGAA